MNLHGSLQYKGWFVLTGIRIPRLLCVTTQLFLHYHEAMHVKHAAPLAIME